MPLYKACVIKLSPASSSWNTVTELISLCQNALLSHAPDDMFSAAYRLSQDSYSVFLNRITSYRAGPRNGCQHLMWFEYRVVEYVSPYDDQSPKNVQTC